MKKKTVWTKDFSCITLATILSIIGGEAMTLPVSLLVFDETHSTMASAFIMVCGMLPDIVLPILIAPLIDRGKKKRWIVGLDLILGLVYVGMGLLIKNLSFVYGLYVMFTLLTATISVFYRLAYDAWFPDLIPIGFEQQGYAVSGVLYPTICIVMAPVATYLYEHLEIPIIFYLVAALAFCSVMIEGVIAEKGGKEVEEKYTFSRYRKDLKEGFVFLKKEKGIRNIYTYIGITNGAGEGVNLLVQAYYQTNPLFTVTMLGFLKSSEMIGRMLSGMLWYKKEVPTEKRYMFTKFAYSFYESMNVILLFLPFSGMIINRFLCGAIGCGSATIREAAVQSYLPPQIRARINAIFNVMFAVGGIGFQMIAGYLGSIMSYRKAVIGIEIFTLLAMFILIFLPAKENRVVYEAARQEN